MLLTKAFAQDVTAKRGSLWHATTTKPTHQTAKNYATYWANFKANGSGGTREVIG